MFKVEGILIYVSDPFKVGNNGNLKRTFRLDITGNSQYNNIVEFQLFGDRITKVDNIAIGERIEVGFFVNGNMWKPRDGTIERCIMNLDASQLLIIEKHSAATRNRTDVSASAGKTAAIADENPFNQ
jgi:hypothetical protein